MRIRESESLPQPDGTMQSNTFSPVASAAQEPAVIESPQERAVHWKKHVQQWQLSGLSRAAYSKQHNLIYHQMTIGAASFCRAETRSQKIDDANMSMS